MSLLISDEEIKQVGREILEAAKIRWLSETEVFLILRIPNTLGIPLTASLPHRPGDGSIYLFKTTKDLKDDGYEWKKKYRKDVDEGISEERLNNQKDPGGEEIENTEEDLLGTKLESTTRSHFATTLQESHFKLKINEIPTIQSIHIKLQDDESFKRRIYKLLNSQPSLGYYQLSHYRREDEIKPARSHGVNTFVPNANIGYLVYTWLVEPAVFPLDYHPDDSYILQDQLLLKLGEHVVQELGSLSFPAKRNFPSVESLMKTEPLNLGIDPPSKKATKRAKVDSSMTSENLQSPSRPIDTSGLEALLTAINQTTGF